MSLGAGLRKGGFTSDNILGMCDGNINLHNSQRELCAKDEMTKKGILEHMQRFVLLTSLISFPQTYPTILT